MTEEENYSTKAQHEAVAEAFGRDLDPLAAYDDGIAATGVDPFALFSAEVLDKRSIAPSTRDDFRRVFDQWREHMADIGRHPACPNEEHVKQFIYAERDVKDNAPTTIKEKLRKLSQAYEYWQDDPSFPHPTEYHPFHLAREKVAFGTPDQKKPPRIPIEELRKHIQTTPWVRSRAMIAMQLKLGLRATELCNITLAELGLSDSVLRSHYPELGKHPLLDQRPDAVYIPHDRIGNKSGNPRVLPLDDELHGILSRWLRIRPNNGLPWIFLTRRGNQLRKQRVNELWKECFHPKYAETEIRRPVTSHYGRHRFTTYWRVERGLDRPLIKYMRGDRPDSRSVKDRDGIDEYIHSYYEDIAPLYREGIFGLGYD